MFLAVLGFPDVPDVDARAAAATGLAVVDARRRLQGILPRVLFVSADRDEIADVAARLEAAGFSALAFDPRAATTDGDRVVPRALAMTAEALTVVSGVGVETRQVVPWTAIELVQRGTRHVAKDEKVTSQSRKISVGRTLLAGGIPMTKKVEKTETVSRSADEPFALLHRRDGGDDIILYERRLDYGFLGDERDATSHANLERTVALISARARAPVLDRGLRAPFVSGIPECGVDPADVAAYLSHLAWRTLAMRPDAGLS